MARRAGAIRILKKTPVLLPVVIIAAITASVQGHLNRVMIGIVAYIALIYGIAFLMAALAFLARNKDDPGVVSYVVMGICLLWSLSLIIWFFTFGHLIDFFNPKKRPWINFQVRRRARRFFQGR